MNLLNGVLSSYSAKYQSSSVLKLLTLGWSSEKSERRADCNEILLREAISAITRTQPSCSDVFLSRLILSISVIYSRQLKDLEAKLDASVGRLDRANDDGGILVRSIVPKSSRKRQIVETPLVAVPEDALLLDSSAIMIEMPTNRITTLNVTRTPLSGRRRLFSTPRADEEEPAFSSTPDISTPDMESKRQKRMSSVSEVMDSLRADDGQRRLSGLLMTNNGSIPPSPAMNDDFDVGIDPPSPWLDDIPPNLALPPLTSPTETNQVQRREKKRRSMMDRKGRWGTEIDPSKIQGRRQWYLEESKFYMRELNVDSIRRYKLSDLVQDRTGHYTWYTKPTVDKQRNIVTTGEEENDMPDWSFNDDISTEAQVGETITDLIGKGLTVKQVTELNTSKPSRRFVARNLMDLLGLMSKGKARICISENATRGFSVTSSSQPLLVV